MNLLAIVIADSIGVFLALSVLRISYMDRKGNDPDAKLLTALLVICCSCCLMDMVSFLADGKASSFCGALIWITNTWLYLGNPLFSTLWLLYVDYHLYKKEKRLTTIYKPHLILLAICWIAVLGNIFGHYLFDLDSQNAYYRQPASYSLYLTAILMIGNSAFVFYRYRRRHHVEFFFPIWIFLTPVLIGIALQSIFYGLSLAWCCISMGLAALYMSTQTELAFRDPLTGLYNRHYLDRVLNTWTGHSGIMLDMDFFKDINDRFGHSVGDEALRKTADLLREASPDDSIAFRFAGDEFILLLTTNTEEAIREVEEEIRKAVEAFNRSSGQPYAISLSMGHAVFDSNDKDAFMEAIDSAMYIDKRAKHTSGMLKDRRHNGMQ
ncbi:MAG: GGDEF domain-containing protein [Clostridia bacterium]|nr:GGDEF domain-containing protein [Clostridia bacterium]